MATDDISEEQQALESSLKERIVKQFQEKKKSTVYRKLKKTVYNRLGILQWIGDYNTEFAINDLIAGITLGLTIIPESIACALLAGLPNYGLCSSFVGPLIYIIFGSIPKVIIGPTSLVALVSVQFTIGKPVEFAIMLTFLSGIVQLLMSVSRLGFIFEFISMPVIKAFSSATAILVIESQLKVIFGIKYLVSGFRESVRTFVSNLHQMNSADLTMGLAAIIFLIVFGLLERLSEHKKINKMGAVILRYLAFSRNTLLVLITALVSFIWLLSEPSVPYALSSNTASGLPNFSIPAFQIVTPDRVYSIWDIILELNIAILVIPIIGILTNISIGKLGPKGLVDADQELFTVGLCNTIGSCFQSMPTSGAFTRYAISTACNLKTPLANLYLGVIVLLALALLSPYFNYIPEASLAAVLICSIYTLLDFKLPRRLWRESKKDFFIWLLCFTICVLCGVEVGLLISVIATMLHLLYLWARPNIIIRIEEIDEMQYICVIPEISIYFPAINKLREKVLKACERAEFQIPVVIDGAKVSNLDYTAAQGISTLAGDLCKQDDTNSVLLILYRMPAHIQRVIDISENLVFCEDANKLREFLTQEFLRCGHINLQAHIRTSIDLGYRIDIID